jgi:hypothetical protein
MSRTWSTWSIPMLSLFVLLAACQSPTPTKADAPAPTKVAAPETKPVAPDPVAPSLVAPAADPEGSSSEPSDAAPGPAPSWFSPDAFEHVAIIRQDLTGTRVPSGQASAMIVLELPAATTPEQCVEHFRAKLAETVPAPPTASTMPQGHLSLRGKGDNYEYTVVCGIAKGKPTMFLSYIQ